MTPGSAEDDREHHYCGNPSSRQSCAIPETHSPQQQASRLKLTQQVASQAASARCIWGAARKCENDAECCCWQIMWVDKKAWKTNPTRLPMQPFTGGMGKPRLGFCQAVVDLISRGAKPTRVCPPVQTCQFVSRWPGQPQLTPHSTLAKGGPRSGRKPCLPAYLQAFGPHNSPNRQISAVSTALPAGRMGSSGRKPGIMSSKALSWPFGTHRNPSPAVGHFDSSESQMGSQDGLTMNQSERVPTGGRRQVRNGYAR